MVLGWVCGEYNNKYNNTILHILIPETLITAITTTAGLVCTYIAIAGIAWTLRGIIWSNRIEHEKYIKQARCKSEWRIVKQCIKCGKIERLKFYDKWNI